LIPLRDTIRLERWPLVTIALIVANVVAYLVAVAGGGSLIDGPSASTVVAYGAIPYELTHLSSHCGLAAAGFSQTVLCTGQAGVIGKAAAQPATWETAFSSMFLHANVLALAIDVLFLAVFGATLENALRRLRFLAFYIAGGLVALALAVAVSPDSTAATLGASGAIAAVLGGYVVQFPQARVLSVVLVPFFFRISETPAWALAAAWVALYVLLGALGVTTPLGGGATAGYYGYLGGFAFGLVAVRAFARMRIPRYGPLRTA
jgi:membrane associated rhomboid family serine protease